MAEVSQGENHIKLEIKRIQKFDTISLQERKIFIL